MANRARKKPVLGTSSKLEYQHLDDRNADDNEPTGIDGEISAQQLEMKQQDESLDMLHDSVQRLGHISLHIGNELDTQNKMLDELNSDVDEAKNALDYVTKQTQLLIKKSGGAKWFAIIATLTGVLIVLFLLVIYT